MFEVFQTMVDVPRFTWVVALLMSGSICWFLKAIVGSTGLAILFGPVLFFGALVSTYVINVNSIMLSGDKNTHSVAAAAIGILVALLFLVGAYVMTARASESRSKARKVPDALTDPRAR